MKYAWRLTMCRLELESSASCIVGTIARTMNIGLRRCPEQITSCRTSNLQSDSPDSADVYSANRGVVNNNHVHGALLLKLARARGQILLAVWFALWLAAGVLAADPATELQLVDGLRSRRLFTLADLVCQQQIARTDLTDRQRAEWVAEGMRTLGQHALNSAPSEQAAHWLRAEQLAQQFAERYADNPFQVFVALQSALNNLTHGELLRVDAELNERPVTEFESARNLIRQASRQLEQIDRDLTDQLNHSGNSDLSSQLQEHELSSLQNHVRYHRARAYRNQSLCYADGSDDRSASLALAVEQLGQLLTQVSAEDSLIWSIYLEQLACYRLQHDWDQAQLVLDSLTSNAAPAAVRMRAQAEQVRLHLARGETDQALTSLETFDTKLARIPEWDYAALETYLAIWETAAAAGRTEDAQHWQRQASDAISILERDHGTYWARRGEMLMLAVARETTGAENLDILTRVADNLYLKGQFDEAIRGYDAAAKKARDAGKLDQAFDLSFKGALVAQQRKQHDLASQRFRQLALSRTTHEKASQAHLLAIWNEAQTLGDQDAAADPYVAMLREHLGNWPDDETADTARMWLARLYESRHNWKLALEVFRSVHPESKHFAQAVAGAGRLSYQWLEQLRDAQKPLIQAYQEAVDFFQPLFVNDSGQLPQRWSLAQAEAVVAVARLRLSFRHEAARSHHETTETAQWLKAAIRNCPEAPDSWRETAFAYLIVALAIDPTTRDEASRLIAEFGNGSPDRLLELADRLAELATAGDEQMQQDLATLELAVLEHVSQEKNQLDKQQRRDTALAQAEALRKAGDRQQALEAYKTLAKQYPNNGQVQIGYARLLSEICQTQPTSCDAALLQWRRVVPRLQRETDNWYLGKISIAEAYFFAGQPAEAAKRIRYLQATSSVDLTKWKSRADELLKACQNQPENSSPKKP
jgi:hypothetical protein